LIPTSYRNKLPKHLSYPVGAGEISTALAAAVHVKPLSLGFHSRPVEPASEFQRILVARQPYSIVQAIYHPARKPGLSAAAFMIEAGWYDECWDLAVYPVLREHRHIANRLLQERGFPALSLWVHKAVRAAQEMVTQRMELVFDPAEESLLANESGRYESSRV
jgi:hypothetical protein